MIISDSQSLKRLGHGEGKKCQIYFDVTRLSNEATCFGIIKVTPSRIHTVLRPCCLSHSITYQLMSVQSVRVQGLGP